MRDGDIPTAIGTHEAALDLHEQLGDPEGAVIDLESLTVLSSRLGDATRSIAYAAITHSGGKKNR